MLLKKMTVCLISLLVLISCSDLNQLSQETLGSINLILGLDSRTIQPEPEGYSVSYYQITLTDPDGNESSSILESTNVFTKEEMIVGEWSIFVECFNGSDIKIAEKNQVFNIEEGKTTDLEVIAELIEGAGEFEMILSWEDGIFVNPEFLVTLTQVDDSTNVLDLSSKVSIDGNLATLKENIDTGKYFLSLKVIDSVEKWGLYEVVTIIDSLKSKLNKNITKFDLIMPNKDNLSLKLYVDADLKNSVKPTVFTHPLSVEPGNDITIQINNIYTEYDEYEWYINGNKEDSSTTNLLTIGSELSPGRYNYTCVVKKNNDYGAVTGVFNVLNSFSAIYNYSFKGTEYKYFDDIEYDGTNFWFFKNRLLVCLDHNMNIIDSYPISGLPEFNDADLAWDGNYLYILSEGGSIHKVDTEDFTATRVAFLDGNFNDIEWDGEYFWIFGEYKYEKCTSEFDTVATYENPIGGYTSTSSAVWVGNYLWVVDRTIEPTLYLFQFTDNSFSLIHEYDLSSNLPDNLDQNTMGGITFDGENFWFASRDNPTIYKGSGKIAL